MIFRLTHVRYSRMFMTYGPRQRCPESRAFEPRPRPPGAVRATARGRRAIGARLLHFSPTSLSLPTAGAIVERTGAGERAQTRLHGQASARFNSARAVVRICQKDVNQRSREPGAIGAAATKGRSWLSPSRSRHALFSRSIDLIACWPTNWPMHISCWYPTGAGPSEKQHPPDVPKLSPR